MLALLAFIPCLYPQLCTSCHGVDMLNKCATHMALWQWLNLVLFIWHNLLEIPNKQNDVGISVVGSPLHNEKYTW